MLSKFVFAIIILLLLSSCHFASAGVKDVDIVLHPDPTTLTWISDGQVIGPGLIDASALQFLVAKQGDEGTARSGVDVVLVKLPDYCAQTTAGCVKEWHALGIGLKRLDLVESSSTTSSSGSASPFDLSTLPDQWCCNLQAMTAGLCDKSKLGQLLIEDSLLEGVRFTVTVPRDMRLAPDESRLYVKETGTYALVFANCGVFNDRIIEVTGQVVWKSQYGYLPADLIPSLVWEVVLSAVYVLFSLWYGYNMRRYKSTLTAVQKTVGMALLFGTMEAIFRWISLLLWNNHGAPVIGFSYLVVFTAIIKEAITLSLMIMVSVGRGVTMTVIVLGTLYFCAAAVVEILDSMLFKDLVYANTASDTDFRQTVYDANELKGARMAFQSIVIVIGVVSAIWVLVSLRKTTAILQGQTSHHQQHQQAKLQRFKRFRWIASTGILMAFIISIMEATSKETANAAIAQRQWMFLIILNQLNYFFVIVGIACLWRPGPNAAEFTYVRESAATTTSFLDKGGDDDERDTGAVNGRTDQDDDDFDDDDDNGEIHHDLEFTEVDMDGLTSMALREQRFQVNMGVSA